MNDLADFRSFERALLFWLGIDAAEAAASLMTHQQRASEVFTVDHTEAVDE